MVQKVDMIQRLKTRHNKIIRNITDAQNVLIVQLVNFPSPAATPSKFDKIAMPMTYFRLLCLLLDRAAIL